MSDCLAQEKRVVAPIRLGGVPKSYAKQVSGKMDWLPKCECGGLGCVVAMDRRVDLVDESMID